jgi:regulator of PEP synthase PpsR (kinase-PPPase family)
MGKAKMRIFVASDGTGQTAQRVVQAALVQFGDSPITIVRRGNVRRIEQLQSVVAEAAGQNALLVHTLVADDLRRAMGDECRRQQVDCLDVLGPLLERLAIHLEVRPQEKPGLLAQLTEARSREIEAVDYAFHHDDGQNSDDLSRAEVVLAGVSRSMKTPTMLYLAYRGWFAANVPLAPGLDVPSGLQAVAPTRVFCLRMATDRLLELRRVRAEKEKLPIAAYTAADEVRKEIEYARSLTIRHGWREIDATGKSVEEVSREIIALLPPPNGPGRSAEG